MDKPADPATPFAEVYQSFLDDLVLHGRKPSTIHRYQYNIVRFETWLIGEKPWRPPQRAFCPVESFTHSDRSLGSPIAPRDNFRRSRAGPPIASRAADLYPAAPTSAAIRAANASRVKPQVCAGCAKGSPTSIRSCPPRPGYGDHGNSSTAGHRRET
jgi:hypothetical protein